MFLLGDGGIGWEFKFLWIFRDFLFFLVRFGIKVEEFWNWGERDDERRNFGSFFVGDFLCWGVFYGFGK